MMSTEWKRHLVVLNRSSKLKKETANRNFHQEESLTRELGSLWENPTAYLV